MSSGSEDEEEEEEDDMLVPSTSPRSQSEQTALVQVGAPFVVRAM